MNWRDMTAQQKIKAIASARAQGRTTCEIAEMYQASYSAVASACTRHKSHIDPMVIKLKSTYGAMKCEHLFAESCQQPLRPKTRALRH